MKKTKFIEVIRKLFNRFFKDFTNHRKSTNKEAVFNQKTFTTFLNAGNTDKIFQQYGQKNSIRHILKSSAG